MRDDEGCQGNPPYQPASAYFSPLSRSRDQYSIPRWAPGPNARAPFSHSQGSLKPPFVLSLSLRHLLTCLSTCALPSTVTNQPSPFPYLFFPRGEPPIHLAPSSLESYLRLSLNVSHRCSLYLYSSLASSPFSISFSMHLRILLFSNAALSRLESRFWVYLFIANMRLTNVRRNSLQAMCNENR